MGTKKNRPPFAFGLARGRPTRQSHILYAKTKSQFGRSSTGVWPIFKCDLSDKVFEYVLRPRFAFRFAANNNCPIVFHFNQLNLSETRVPQQRHERIDA